MADDATTTTPETDEGQPTAPAPEPAPSGTPETVAEAPTPTQEHAPEFSVEGTDWKAEARKWEARAKSNRAAAENLDKVTAERDDAHEKLTSVTEELTGLKKARVHEQLIDEVAARYRVNAKLLRGADRKELEAHAELLAEAIPGLPVVAAQGDRPEIKDDPNRALVRDLFAGKHNS